MIRLLKLNLFRPGRGLATTCKRLEKSNNEGSQHHQRPKLQDGPSLEHFIANSQSKTAGLKIQDTNESIKVPYLTEQDISGDGRKGTLTPYIYIYIYSKTSIAHLWGHGNLFKT